MASDPSTLDTVEAKPGDLISPLLVLGLKDLEIKDMRTIFKEAWKRNEVRNWEDILAAAPNALNSIGKCFIVALSGDVSQITRKEDKLIVSDLRADLVKCSDLGLNAFSTAEDKMGSIRTNIASITEYNGIMDRILTVVAEIASAVGKSEDDLQTSQTELEEWLKQLVRCAEECTRDSELVVETFAGWHEEVNEFYQAYTKTYGKETRNRNQIEIDGDSLLAELNEIENREENASFLEKLRVAMVQWIKKYEDPEPRALRSRMANLATQYHNKTTVLQVLESFQDTLKQIKVSLELLNRFFKGLRRQIENLSTTRLQTFSKDVSKGNLTNKLHSIYYDACRIRCMYMQAESKAAIYVEASEKYILPGVKLIHELDIVRAEGVDDSIMKNKAIQLDAYYENALADIRASVKVLPTLEQLQKQIEDEHVTSGKLLPAPKQLKKQIADGHVTSGELLLEQIEDGYVTSGELLRVVKQLVEQIEHDHPTEGG